MSEQGRILVTGAAGLIGQNLIPRLKAGGARSIVAIDKHPANTEILRKLHPDIEVIQADLSVPGEWSGAFREVRILVLNHAQIGALDETPFIANNVTATEHVLAAARMHEVPYIVHISSSVVNSLAQDNYVKTKREQERLVLEAGIPCTVLRPTLMFGWFDRKHLGWLARFMQRSPVFPVPGHGRYRRQPLYAGDFSRIIASCVAQPRPGEIHNVSGLALIDYIDLVREVRSACGARTAIVRIPYGLFKLLLQIYALIDRNPPFTVSQLEALVIPETFEVSDWPGVFGVPPTALEDALRETFSHPEYSKITLEF